MDNQEIISIMKKTKHAKIDIRKTIENSIECGIMDACFYVEVLDNKNYVWNIIEFFENNDEYYKGNFDDEYYLGIEKEIEKDGVYISLRYYGEEVYSFMESDFGIKVQKIDNEFNITFGKRGGASCQHAPRFYPIKSPDDDTIQTLDEDYGINLIKDMYEIIVFDE